MSHGGFGGHGGHGGHHGGHGGFGHHHTNHHHTGLHHPDQAPTWNQALQGDTFWQKLLKIDRRPFAILFFMFFSAFTWLYIIYKLHHQEVKTREAADATTVSTQAPAPISASRGPDITSQTSAYSAVSSQQGFGQFGSPSVAMQQAAPSQSVPMAPSATAYGGSSQAGAAFGANNQYGCVIDPHGSISAPINYRHALTNSGMNSYEPMPNGRQKLVVSR